MRVPQFLLVVTLLSGCGHGAPPPSAVSDKLGQAVSFSLPSDDGALVTVPLPSARVTVLDFFGPTCEPCRKKVPELIAQRGVLAARDAKLVLIGVLAEDESSDDAKRALASWGVVAPFLVDSQGTGKREAGVTTLPATIVLDARGTLKWVAPAGASAEDVVAATE
jgi:thiol-disulfide isomerase/thioredoxin